MSGSKLSAFAVLFLGSVLLGGCPEPQVEPTLESIQAMVFNESCSFESCHGGSSPEGDLDLTSASVSYAALVGVDGVEEDMVRVVAGDPASSLLYQVLQGDVGSVRQMPVGYDLTDEEIEAVRQWIADGAPETSEE